MKLHLTNGYKFLLAFVLGTIAVIGFMVKLPSVFRHYDKELHTLFYFLAAALLNLLFSKRNIIIHALVFALLYGGSIFIEHAQEYSNKLLGKRIHGRYDPEDVTANLKGLIAFSILWVICVFISYLWQFFTAKKKEEESMSI
ncbi:MAG TPA: hypothetical protein VLC98_01315 [Phnomibacter sp.]|nr:hypothetical protein [Phnomibacter sp.]